MTNITKQDIKNIGLLYLMLLCIIFVLFIIVSFPSIYATAEQEYMDEIFVTKYPIATNIYIKQKYINEFKETQEQLYYAVWEKRFLQDKEVLQLSYYSNIQPILLDKVEFKRMFNSAYDVEKLYNKSLIDLTNY